MGPRYNVFPRDQRDDFLTRRYRARDQRDDFLTRRYRERLRNFFSLLHRQQWEEIKWFPVLITHLFLSARARAQRVKGVHWVLSGFRGQGIGAGKDLEFAAVRGSSGGGR